MPQDNTLVSVGSTQRQFDSCLRHAQIGPDLGREDEPLAGLPRGYRQPLPLEAIGARR